MDGWMDGWASHHAPSAEKKEQRYLGGSGTGGGLVVGATLPIPPRCPPHGTDELGIDVSHASSSPGSCSGGDRGRSRVSMFTLPLARANLRTHVMAFGTGDERRGGGLALTCEEGDHG